MIHLGNNIRHLRKKMGMNQSGLATLLGVTNSQVGYYENGNPPPLDKIQKLVEIFNVSYDDLINKDLRTIPAEDLSKSSTNIASEPAAKYALPPDIDQMQILRVYQQQLLDIENTLRQTSEGRAKLKAALTRFVPTLEEKAPELVPMLKAIIDAY